MRSSDGGKPMGCSAQNQVVKEKESEACREDGEGKKGKGNEEGARQVGRSGRGLVMDERKGWLVEEQLPRLLRARLPSSVVFHRHPLISDTLLPDDSTRQDQSSSLSQSPGCSRGPNRAELLYPHSRPAGARQERPSEETGLPACRREEQHLRRDKNLRVWHERWGLGARVL